MLIAITIIIIFIAIGAIVIRQPRFGRRPSGIRLKQAQASSNYKNGSFQNQSITPDLTEGATYYSVLKEFIFGKSKRVKPIDEIPSKKTDLMGLDKSKDLLVWFGHSSYFMQIDGKRILVDPVLSGHASPFSFTTKAFTGTDRYTPADIPMIDYLFISHDHWDHLDYKTITELKPKIKKVICSLGTGEHFERWDFDKNILIEKDWNEQILLDDGFIVHTIPARHFSGRSFKRNQALWTSYVFKTPTMNIFIGGDSGYDKHFAETGNAYGPFDLAILENGQYDKSWKYIHMQPAEVLQAAADLKATRLLPVHSSKFALANHDWDAPLKTITAINQNENLVILTPMIGEQVNLKNTSQQFLPWWEGVK